MIRSFFQSLESHGVRYLLISGQATVLYQAVELSEDFDLWIEPTEANLSKTSEALRAVGATYYKLTPPFTVANMARGHGFHFRIGQGEGEEVDVDIMGQPPRVGRFENSFGSKQIMESEWGLIPVVGVKDLAEIKKTQRLRDYSIISALARRWPHRPEFNASANEFRWTLDNTFSLSDLETLAHEVPLVAAVAEPDSKRFIELTCQEQDVPIEVELRLQDEFQKRVSQLQTADRSYWKEIIRELRRFKATGQIAPVGKPV